MEIRGFKMLYSKANERVEGVQNYTESGRLSVKVRNIQVLKHQVLVDTGPISILRTVDSENPFLRKY